ncbi:MAG: T9SS type A sorting domain-containing protein [Bacteroidota bacterium]
MKKLLIFLTGLLWLFPTFAQPSLPMLSHETVWVHNLIGLGFNSNDKITADSAHTISGETVYRLHALQPGFPDDSPMDIGLLREDTTAKQIYWYPPGTDSLIADSSYLLYDFDMAVGDTGTFVEFYILFYPGEPITYTPTRLRLDSTQMDTISWDGPGFEPITSQKHCLSHVDDVTFYPIVWLEGVGSLIHFLQPAQVSTMSDLTCFTKDSVREFSASDVWLPNPDIYCYSDQVVSVEEKITEAFSLYPNPASDLIQIKLSEPRIVKMMTLINQSGQVVKRIEVPFGETEFRVRLDGLPGGMYILLGNGEKGAFSRKFVKN